jgi:hypothetical protein
MRFFYLLWGVLWVNAALSQQEYFSEETKKEGVSFFQKSIYNGCMKLKEKQEPIPEDAFKKLTFDTAKVVEENFSKAFEENPKIKADFINYMGFISLYQKAQ